MQMRLTFVLLLGLLAWPSPGQAEDARLRDAKAAFEAAQAMWDRSPSPAIDTLLRRALTLQEAGGGGTDRMAARIRNRIGRNAYNGKSFAIAEPMFRDAVALGMSDATPKDLEFAAFLGDLGASLRELGRYPEAWDPVCRSLAIRRAALGENDPQVAASLNNMGRIALGERRNGEAYALMADAYEINRKAYGDAHPAMRREAEILEHVRKLAQGRRIDADPCTARVSS